jgi:hypothetical protein
MDTAVATGRNGFERALMVLHLNVQAQAGPLSPLMLQPGRLSLPDDEMSRITKASQRLRMTSARNLRQGMADGSVRPCDTTFVGDVAAGIFLWLPKWLPDTHPMTPKAIADEVADLMAMGLEKRAA